MSYTKNYYHILGLNTHNPASTSASTRRAGVDRVELRRAYRSALLLAHPDKKGANTPDATSVHSVDDVKEAYRVLDCAKSRAEYDNWVLRHPGVLDVASGAGGNNGNDIGGGAGGGLSQDFILGLELLDLSDFEESEYSPAENAAEMQWTRACRCGDLAGFRILEVDLEDAEARGEKEVLVGCSGCSLWVRVGFDVEEG